MTSGGCDNINSSRTILQLVQQAPDGVTRTYTVAKMEEFGEHKPIFTVSNTGVTARAGFRHV